MKAAIAGEEEVNWEDDDDEEGDFNDALHYIWPDILIKPLLLYFSVLSIWKKYGQKMYSGKWWVCNWTGFWSDLSWWWWCFFSSVIVCLGWICDHFPSITPIEHNYIISLVMLHRHSKRWKFSGERKESKKVGIMNCWELSKYIGWFRRLIFKSKKE